MAALNPLTDSILRMILLISFTWRYIQGKHVMTKQHGPDTLAASGIPTILRDAFYILYRILK